MGTDYGLSNNSTVLVRRFFRDNEIDALPFIPLYMKGLLINRMLYVKNVPSGASLASVFIWVM